MACGKIISDIPQISVTNHKIEEADRLLASDPQGPIPKPSIPQDDLLDASPAPALAEGQKIVYEVEILCPNNPKGLKDMLAAVSDLHTMADRPLSSALTLTRRLRSSLQQAQDLLQSLGYFEGQAQGSMDEISEKYKITIRLIPGPLYTLEPGLVIIAAGDLEAKSQNFVPVLPCPAEPCPASKLSQAGLVEGGPAKADDVLAAVDRLAVIWQNAGYPEAQIISAHYSIDPQKRTLLAEVTLQPGPYVTMGKIVQTTESGVKDGYLAAYTNWKPSQSWSQALADSYRETLIQTGLFKSAEIAHSPNNDQVLLTLEAAPWRTVSGSVNYDSDFGPGLEISWEHRNLTGWGDRLRFDLPMWADLLQLGASYQRPFFLSLRQNLLLDAAILNENSDSYNLRSLSAAVGLERFFTKKIKVVFGASLEVGSLEEATELRSNYMVTGFPTTLEWSDADSFLDAHKGLRLSALLSPYFGHYRRDFKVLKYRLDASFYHPLKGPDTLILALRAAVGVISGSQAQALPTSLRFFGGGGKSVRGYEYQSIGPKNSLGRPAGGTAVNEVGAELRYRWSKTMGVTAFVDGGMVYDSLQVSELGQNLLWGGGVGFRYYSPIGPFRLDIATPLTPRAGDDPIQLYLSLGQSF
jgi:translocation and assembly module TamA